MIICAVAIFSVVIISLVGNIITIGDKAAEIHPWVGWGFYIVLGLFLVRFILYPTLKFLFTPELKGDGREQLEDMDSNELAGYIKRMSLTQQEKEIFSTKERALEGVREVLRHRDDEANKLVRRAALNVFIVTGISQNGSLDIITAFGVACFFHTYMPLQVFELFVAEMTDRYRLELHCVKTVFDICLLVISVSLALMLFGDVAEFDWRTIYYNSFHSLGLGTLVTTLINAPLINLMSRIISRVFDDSARFLKLEKFLKR